MTTSLEPADNAVSILAMRGVTLTDLDVVDSWLHAIDMSDSERRSACRQVFTDGLYSVCNIEYRVEVYCSA